MLALADLEGLLQAWRSRLDAKQQRAVVPQQRRDSGRLQLSIIHSQAPGADWHLTDQVCNESAKLSMYIPSSTSVLYHHSVRKDTLLR